MLQMQEEMERGRARAAECGYPLPVQPRARASEPLAA